MKHSKLILTALVSGIAALLPLWADDYVDDVYVWFSRVQMTSEGMEAEYPDDSYTEDGLYTDYEATTIDENAGSQPGVTFLEDSITRQDTVIHAIIKR